MTGSRLASLTRGPALPPVREAALAFTYVVTCEGPRSAIVSREDGERQPVRLARSVRRVGRPDWRALAHAILLDATATAPATKLAADLGRFIGPGAGESYRLTGADLAAWLESWRPALATLFGSPR
jgi:hypothetical protein